MDFTETKDLIGWVLGLIATTVISIAIGIFNIIKSGRSLPKELKKADLDNKSKEVSIADQFDELASKAAEKAIKSQERLDKIESDYRQLSDDYKLLKEDNLLLKTEYNKVQSGHMLLSGNYTKLKESHESLQKQVNEQQILINRQAEKILAQDEEIVSLVCEINNYKVYTNALIAQMREAQIVPIEIESLPIENCKKKKNNKGDKDGNKI